MNGAFVFPRVALALLFAAQFLVGGARADSPPPPAGVSLDWWKSGQPPFSFVYGGRDSRQFIGSWQKTVEPATPGDGGTTYHYTYLDPATKLKVTADVRTFRDFDAVDWVLHVSNGGAADTPVLEKIEALDSTLSLDATEAVVHSAGGSSFFPGDFGPIDNLVPPGATFQMGSSNGRSSSGQSPLARLPFFNLQAGDHGIFGAVGWTGSWLATFARDSGGKSLELSAGFLKTHLVLHPGETIRTPRILLLNWRGSDWTDAQNLWRRLALAYYSPKDPAGNRVTMPICYGSWGTELASAKLAAIKALHEAKAPVEVYWIDAGWYGAEDVPPGETLLPEGKSPWQDFRGDWYPSKTLYPDGLKPIGDLSKQYNMGFLLWFEPETANVGTDLPKEHPGWYLHSPLPHEANHLILNLGDPEARKGITDMVSNTITEAGLTWYRQDSNVLAFSFWNAADAPDRIGMTEIKYITGLYQFWDDLRARRPGLQIDNCAGGGTRLDLETMSRSVSLWRSDNAGPPISEQSHTQGLVPWFPLNSGVWGAFQGQPGSDPGTPGQDYARRSAYCAGLTFDTDFPPGDWMKPALEEYREVRPYFCGDFHALTTYDFLSADTWSAWQLDRPDLKSGVLILLRRHECLYSGLVVHGLHGIDPAAQYEVEIRPGLEKGAVRRMSGADLSKLEVNILDKPGSALVFFKRI